MNSITKDSTSTHIFYRTGGDGFSIEALPIVFREDGYINGSKAAKHFGKDIREFFRLDITKVYMKALEKMMGIPINIQKHATRGRNGATFIHPKLAVRLSQWLDVHFAVWCDLMIDNILKGNIQTTVVVPTQEAVDVQAIVAPFKAEILDLKAEVQRLQEEGFLGDVPDGWQTAGCYLEDRGVPPKHIKAYAMELGTLAANEMTRKRQADASIASKKGTVEKDKTYYPQDVLAVAYQKLKEAQLGLFAGLLP